MPGGWTGNPTETIFVDSEIVHGGRASVRINRNADSAGNFTAISKVFDIDIYGKTLELRGFLRTKDVNGTAGLWLREDGDQPNLAFDNMQSRGLKGTTEWTEYSIKLPVVVDATKLIFGVLLSGTGTVWADDLQLLVDRKPVWEAPERVVPKTILDSDHEFDGGSGIKLKELTALQIENLATLGKVWGFLKYHHPLITTGQRHFDYDLFRILPAVLSSPDRNAANSALLRWIDGLGAVTPCKSCVTLSDSDLYMRPQLDWISDQTLLGKDLSTRLRYIYANRRDSTKQFYVSQAPGVGNPVFEHERAYGNISLPDAGFQLLSLYRFWNIIEYWYPYRDVLGEDWDKVLREFIPRIALAETSPSYQRELMALIARVHDTHANLWSSLQQRPPTGDCILPFSARFIENQPVITEYLGVAASDPAPERGDIITSIDGTPVSKLIEGWAQYYAASNEPTRLRDIARGMTRGACAASAIGIRRADKDLELKLTRAPAKSLTPERLSHDLPGDTFRLLSKDVAYLKLSSVKAADVKRYIDGAAGTKGLIIDIRNYPSEFVVFALGSLLVNAKTDFVRFTIGDLSNPGAFHWG